VRANPALYPIFIRLQCRIIARIPPPVENGSPLPEPARAIRRRSGFCRKAQCKAGATGRPRKYPLRGIWNVIFYIGKNGCTWRPLSSAEAIMRLEWFIARRYLSSGRGSRYLSLITLIAMGGVFVGVTALIIVTAVMTGLQNELREKILGTNPHIWLTSYGDNMRLDACTLISFVATLYPSRQAAALQPLEAIRDE
jgi:hypothetical protein